MLHRPAAPGSMSAAVAALLTLVAALVVIVFGVIATTGVYGSRLAWLLGVALPLLATSMVLSRVAVRATARVQPGLSPAGPAPGRRVSQVMFAAAALLFGIPIALAATLLGAYALLFALHGISLLR